MSHFQHSAAASRLTPPARPRWHERLTPYGISLFFIALLVAGSAFRSLRLEIGPLLVHPYLVPMLALGLLGGVPRFQLLPKRVLQPLLVFFFLYCLACTQNGSQISEIVKISASAATVLTCALLVRNMQDYRAGVLGLSAAAAVLSFRGLASSAGLAGINPFEQVANKNALSLYTLPAILMAAHLLLDKATPKWMRLMLAGCAVLSIAAIFATTNRSGWLGVVLIGLLLFGANRQIKAAIAVVLIGYGSFWALNRFSSTRALEFRIEQTTSGYRSDDLRRDLFVTSFKIALDHPILGVSPNRLPVELAKRLRTRTTAIDPHNALAYIAGGCGLLTLAAFALGALALWKRPPSYFYLLASDPKRAKYHDILRTVLILWLVRSMFSREILYSPSFSMALGLTLGLSMAGGLWQVPAWSTTVEPPESPPAFHHQSSQ